MLGLAYNSMQALITYSTKFLYKDVADGLFITQEIQDQTADQCTSAITVVESRLLSREYPFIEVLRDEDLIAEAKSVFEQISWAETMVVIGIGGSNLGGIALQGVFGSESAPMEVIFHGDSPDPVAIDRVLARISLEKSVFVIISKSGQTVETMAQYAFFRSKYKNSDTWQKHFVFITDPEDGILRTEAQEHGVTTLPVSPGVGGRFSVLTPVGYLPALGMGINIDQLRTGALKFAEDSEMRSISQQIATTQFQLFKQNCKVVACMPYATQLDEFARWFRQLWAESLGKNGTGILPVQSSGPADQHSQLQFYNEGSKMLSVLFLTVRDLQTDHQLTEIEQPELEHLNGWKMSQILEIEQSSTAQSLHNNNTPSATIQLDRVTPESIGHLFMLFELAVVYLAELLQVNAFDQPGVEESKVLIQRSLRSNR